MSPNILVIGRSGQLASELALAAPANALRACGRDTLDLTALEALPDRLRELAPDAIINAAAYTAVDKAESEPDAAMLLNRDGPGVLASVCADLQIPLVHISSDYVFDGANASPYVEADPTSPTSVYGHSKLEGEQRILAAGGRAAILRTSWVYSAFGANFLKTMLRVAATRDEISVVDDQIGRPTWARDLAEACLEVTRRLGNGDDSATGVFHYSGAGDATWADFACHIFETAKRLGYPTAAVSRITSAEYPTPVKRPANSRLDTTKFENVFNLKPRDWREACELCMKQLPPPA